jgi:para-nitrobenzyl esterase
VIPVVEKRAIRLSTLLPILLMLLNMPVQAAPPTTLEISTGRLQGALSPHANTIAVFKGIPYAEPPVGRLRWRPPVKASSWHNIRQAIAPGAPCMQPIVPETSIYSRGPMDVSEDCLYLNVWTPGSSDDEALPVLVWFHGGSNTTGHGSSLIFDGANLARKGAVVVTVNYRLGALGFMAHPALSAESAHGTSGNYALLDQLEALRWVQKNIAQFGGDPRRVVIFGQSAGALDVCLLMASPLAKGLISGVIAHSGGCLRTETTLEEAEAAGIEAASVMGIDPAATTATAELRSIPAQQLLEQQSQFAIRAPIVDGYVIPEAPQRLFEQGRYNRVPVIAGAMADEFRGLAPELPEMTEKEYADRVATTFGPHAEAIRDAYQPIAAQSTREAFHKISTHSFFTWQSRAWAELMETAGSDAWLYQFSHPTAVFSLYIPERPEFPDPNGPRGLGAYHSGDLAYHFNNIGLVGMNWTPWDAALADMLSSYWVNFAATGNPNGSGLPPWPGYTRASSKVQVFADEVSTQVHPLNDKLDLFDEVFADSP